VLNDLNIQVGDIDERTQQTQGTLTQHIEDAARHHTQQQTNHEATMELLRKQYEEAQAFYRTMGITLHPVSKLAWEEGVPEDNMYLAFAYFPFHHIALHCQKRERSCLFLFSLSINCFVFS
jgi:hypothetical protein